MPWTKMRDPQPDMFSPTWRYAAQLEHLVDHLYEVMSSTKALQLNSDKYITDRDEYHAALEDFSKLFICDPFQLSCLIDRS
ncbi:unnamed protein product [Strongylus vulgaris]|uniref:Uncharacterized protein n=1 Tax=Strongylus vulgaris TaxID=40348 RepID=A0A3P7J7B4_STRVU|nr:unnamed protein product [Strongylus vulgaris]